MELCLDTETPEKRVLSWLSKTDMPASIRNNCEVSATLNGTNKNNCAKIKNVSKSIHCCVRQLPKRYQKSGLNKYFSINYENNGESASSDSEREQGPSRSNKLYCDAERNLIIRYIAEKKLFPFIKGNTIWKQMEKERICCRTWQSMKTQFHKYIYPHLDDFDISDTDRCYFALSMTRSPFKKSVGFLSPGKRGWRKNCKFYTFIEDAIILYYILEKDRYEFANGNTLWQRMESKHVVPGRSWHSMKSRYKNFLSKYIERVNSPVKNDNKSDKKKLGAVEKTKLLQDFMVDHLNDVAATLGCLTNSNESLEELRCVGIDCSFSIPLPENDSDFTEREVIKKCVWDIAQQLDEKFHVLREYSNKTATKCKELINVFSPKYPKSFKSREQSPCSPDSNYDLSESVQRELKISALKQCTRNIFETSFAKNSNKPCTVVNPEISDTLDRINFSENVVFERIMHLTEKVEAGVKDCSYNTEENVSNSLFYNSSVYKDDVHFSNTQKKASGISQNRENAGEETTIFNSSEIGNENPLGHTVQEDYMTSDTARYESRYSNGKEIQKSNQNSSSTYSMHMPESFSTVNSLCATIQNDEFIKLPELTLASTDHFFSNSENKDTKEVNKPCITLNKYSNVCDLSSVKLRPSSATIEKIPASEIQREPNNNKQNNLYRDALILETIQKAECSDATEKLCSSEMLTYSVSLNIPENTFTKKPLNINVQSDYALKNTRCFISEEMNILDFSSKSKCDSGKCVRISNEFDNDKLSTCSIAHIDYVGQNSKDHMGDDSYRLEAPPNLNSCHPFTEKHQSNNTHTQLHDRLEVDPEPRFHLTEEGELEPDLRLHLSEDDSEEEPELHLHISEDESEGECELKLQLTENGTGKIQEVPHLSTVSALQNF